MTINIDEMVNVLVENRRLESRCNVYSLMLEQTSQICYEIIKVMTQFVNSNNLKDELLQFIDEQFDDNKRTLTLFEMAFENIQNGVYE